MWQSLGCAYTTDTGGSVTNISRNKSEINHGKRSRIPNDFSLFSTRYQVSVKLGQRYPANPTIVWIQIVLRDFFLAKETRLETCAYCRSLASCRLENVKHGWCRNCCTAANSPLQSSAAAVSDRSVGCTCCSMIVCMLHVQVLPAGVVCMNTRTKYRT